MKSAPSIVLLTTSIAFLGCKATEPPAPPDSPHEAVALERSEPVRLDPQSRDLGAHRWGQKLQVMFRLVNDGATPIVIAAIETGCDCTVALEEYVGQTIAAKSSREIALAMDLKDRQGEEHRNIRVLLEDGRKIASQLRVESLPTYRLSASELDFGTVDPMASQPLERVVAFGSDAGVTVSEQPVSDSDWMSVHLAGDSIYVEVDPARLPLGESRGNVVVRTSDETRVLSSIPVRVRAESKLLADRVRVSLINAAPELVRVTNRSLQPVELRDAKSDHGDLDVSITNPGCIQLRNRSSSNIRAARVTISDAEDNKTIVLVHAYVDKKEN